MATVKTQHVREERWQEKYKDDDGSSTVGMSKTNRNGIYEIKDHTNTT